MKINKIDKKNYFLPILSGFLLTFSFPDFGFSLIAWFALTPLLLSLRNLSWKSGFRMGLLTGIVHYLTLMYWLIPTMSTYGHFPLILSVFLLFLLSLCLSLYIAGFSACLVYAGSKAETCLILIPCFWVAFEYIRSFLFSGFPWELLGYSQFKQLYLIQVSDLTGIYGISFLLSFSNAALLITCLSILKKDWHGKTISRLLASCSIISLTLLLVMTCLYGKWRIRSVEKAMADSPSPLVSVVQGNIPQSVKWDPAFQYATTKKYINLSQTALRQKSKLIIWPETATPFFLYYDTELTGIVLEGIKNSDAYFLIGSPSFTKQQHRLKYYNTAYLINPESAVYGTYSKAHLVPFGEYVPFKRWLPFIEAFVEGVGDFSSGIEGKTLKWNDRNLGIQICYEIIFPDLSRKMVSNGANVLINITNDAWYGKTSAPYQHFSMVLFRAIENRRALVRSANTGISGFIDPVGRIVNSTTIFTDDVITDDIPLLNIKTIYTRFGDLFAGICLAITCIGFCLNYIKQYVKEKQHVD